MLLAVAIASVVIARYYMYVYKAIVKYHLTLSTWNQ